ncbi:MAG: glycosyltransferase family 39 protein [Anaerolineales bacterium]
MTAEEKRGIHSGEGWTLDIGGWKLRLPPWPMMVIVALFLVLGVVYSVKVPLFEASDELWHYPMVAHIAEQWDLPVQPLEPGAESGPWRQEASQPPLYYALGAALTFWIDTADMDAVRHLNPHVAAGEITSDASNVNLIVHDPNLGQFPWQGTALAVHLVRFLSVALGAWAVALTWAIVRELFPHPPWLAPVVAAVHAFTPMYLFISASVNNDNLIVPLCSLALLMMIRRVKAGRSDLWPQGPMAEGWHSDAADSQSALRGRGQRPVRTVKFYLGLGAVIGLGLLTKATAIGLLPLAAATIAWEVWQKARGRGDGVGSREHTALRTTQSAIRNIIPHIPTALRDMLLILAPALAISGWWFYRNFRLYGDWLGLNAFYAVLGARDVPADFAQLWDERFAFAAGYWGNFGGLNVPMPDWAYTILNTVALAALGGLLLRFLFWLTGKELRIKSRESGIKNYALRSAFRLWPFTWDALTAARALAWAWPAAIFVSWIRWATVTWSSQGRLIFSAIPMWSLALVWGLTAWIPRRAASYRRTVALDLAAFLLSLSVIALPAWILPAYRPPPVATTELAHPLDHSFGEVLRLRGYEIASDVVRPGEPVRLTLHWEALSPTATDHSIFVHLVGRGERIIAQRDAFPGRGLISTMWLAPGQTWTEQYRIATPPMAYAPDTLHVAVGVYETASGLRLPIARGPQSTGAEAWEGSSPLESTLRLGEIALVAPDSDVPNPAAIRFGEGIVLRGYDVSEVIAERGERITVTLHWACAAPIPADYTISVQLIDAQWRKAAQSDAWPRDGEAPTSAWEAGQRITETRRLAIDPTVDPAAYDLRVAIYRVDESGALEHLPITWEVGQMPREAMTLTRVRIE